MMVKNRLYFTDTHCHLDMSGYAEDLPEVLDRATQNNVFHIVTIGIDLDSSAAAIQLARKHKMISATVGVHPHDIGTLTDESYQELETLVKSNRKFVVGYGEIGLDYYKNYSEPELQKKHFKKQLLLAKELNLPVIIHDRDAHEDIMSLLKEVGPFENGGVMHCFSGNYSLAREVIDFGFHISIPGIVTFKNAKDLQEVAAKIPLDSMLLETDGPFLAPTPYRGKRNEPSYIPLIAHQIAELRGCELETVAAATSKNANDLFNLTIHMG